MQKITVPQKVTETFFDNEAICKVTEVLGPPPLAKEKCWYHLQLDLTEVSLICSCGDSCIMKYCRKAGFILVFCILVLIVGFGLFV